MQYNVQQLMQYNTIDAIWCNMMYNVMQYDAQCDAIWCTILILCNAIHNMMQYEQHVQYDYARSTCWNRMCNRWGGTVRGIAGSICRRTCTRSMTYCTSNMLGNGMCNTTMRPAIWYQYAVTALRTNCQLILSTQCVVWGGHPGTLLGRSHTMHPERAFDLSTR